MSKKKIYDLSNILPAQHKDPIFEGIYKATAKVYLRKGAGDWPIITVLQKGAKLLCDGSYMIHHNQIWLFVRWYSIYGYVRKDILSEVESNED